MICAGDLISDIYKGINYISPAIFLLSGEEFFGKIKPKKSYVLENYRGKGAA